MNFFNKLFDNSNYVSYLEKQVKSLIKEIELLKETISDFNKVNDELEQYKEIYDCDVIIDFNVMDVFSIERMNENNKPSTIIGYIRPDKTIGEWGLYCSKEQHQRLCEDFKTYLLSKK